MDLYKILNINKNASKDEIRFAYKKLVIKYHPDKNKNTNSLEIFRKIQVAYETLMDDYKRKKYDSFDVMKNGPKIRNIYTYYYELVIEKCHDCEISDEDKEIIIGIFNPDDYQAELENGNVNIIHQKITEKIFPLIFKIVIRNICKKYSMSESETTEIINMFDFKDYIYELDNNNMDFVYQKIIDKIILFLPGFLIKRMNIRYPFIESTINLLTEWFNYN